MGQRARHGGRLVGSITLFAVLILFLVFDQQARIPTDGRHRNDAAVLRHLFPVGHSSRGEKGNVDLSWSTKGGYSSDQIAASGTTVLAPALMEGSRRHESDEQTSFASLFASHDCSGRTPAGHTRIFIAHRDDAKSGSGTGSDPFDGSTAQKFDTLLRVRSESSVTNLVVCIGPGTFQTEGAHDYVPGVDHLNKAQASGFTVNRGWRVHGTTMDRTVLKLTDLYFDPSTGKYLVGHIISTYDLDSHGVEVSDLTLDDNYPVLKAQYRADLQLEAVSLRSTLGKHWIHNIHVTNAAGEWTEAFPVEISSPANSRTESTGNIVEHVTMDH